MKTITDLEHSLIFFINIFLPGSTGDFFRMTIFEISTKAKSLLINNSISSPLVCSLFLRKACLATFLHAHLSMWQSGGLRVQARTLHSLIGKIVYDTHALRRCTRTCTEITYLAHLHHNDYSPASKGEKLYSPLNYETMDFIPHSTKMPPFAPENRGKCCIYIANLICGSKVCTNVINRPNYFSFSVF